MSPLQGRKAASQPFDLKAKTPKHVLIFNPVYHGGGRALRALVQTFKYNPLNNMFWDSLIPYACMFICNKSKSLLG